MLSWDVCVPKVMRGACRIGQLWLGGASPAPGAGLIQAPRRGPVGQEVLRFLRGCSAYAHQLLGFSINAEVLMFSTSNSLLHFCMTYWHAIRFLKKLLFHTVYHITSSLSKNDFQWTIYCSSNMDVHTGTSVIQERSLQLNNFSQGWWTLLCFGWKPNEYNKSGIFQWKSIGCEVWYCILTWFCGQSSHYCCHEGWPTAFLVTEHVVNLMVHQSSLNHIKECSPVSLTFSNTLKFVTAEDTVTSCVLICLH